VAPLEGLKRRIVVYPRAPAMRTSDGIDVMPFQEFASQLDANEL
jgi:hypothetical protein